MARYGKLIRCMIACFASLGWMSVDLVAQKTQPQSTPASDSPEQCTVAFYTQDSVAIKLPQGKIHLDEINRANKDLQKVRLELDTARDNWLKVKDDSLLKSTSAGNKKQLAALNEYTSLIADSLIEIMRIANEYEKLQPDYKSIHLIADSVAKAMGIKHVFESSQNYPMTCPTDKMLMIDITYEIALAVGVKPNRLRVGVYNTDSLLRLMPGYAKLADQTTAEMQSLNDSIAILDKEIRKLQRELDSLRPSLSNRNIREREKIIAEKQEHRDVHWNYESFKINDRDAERTHEYRLKLRNAALSAAQEQDCVKLDDEEDARAYWTEKEAEFVDLNAAIAQKLK